MHQADAALDFVHCCDSEFAESFDDIQVGSFDVVYDFVLHGYTSSGAGQEAYMQFTPLADEFGFLFIAPDGLIDCVTNRFWNGTDACCHFCGGVVDDVAYLSAMIDEVKNQYAIDDLRVKDISWVADATPTAEGQLGMNVATGRLRIFSDGAVRELGGRVLTGTPEGNLVGTITDLALDTAGGDLYFKASGSSDTGWVQLSTLTGNFAQLDVANIFTKRNHVAPVTLTPADNVSLVTADGNVFDLLLDRASTQIDNPGDLADGQVLIIRALQDGTGGRALIFDSAFDFGDLSAPDLTTATAGQKAQITCVATATKLDCVTARGFTG